MSEHHAKITWSRNNIQFNYETYSRDHNWSFDGGVDVLSSAAPEYLGSSNRVDPEEAFVASISSCHMLTFLSIAARKRLIVDSYTDHAIGFMEKNEQERLCITRVTLRPKIEFALKAAFYTFGHGILPTISGRRATQLYNDLWDTGRILSIEDLNHRLNNGFYSDKQAAIRDYNDSASLYNETPLFKPYIEVIVL